jgi:hypothetical protein
MEPNQLDVLEKKIEDIVKLLNDIQTENTELKKQVTQLLEEKRILEEKQQQFVGYQEKEENIKKRIQQILVKLDSVSIF